MYMYKDSSPTYKFSVGFAARHRAEISLYYYTLLAANNDHLPYSFTLSHICAHALARLSVISHTHPSYCGVESHI